MPTLETTRDVATTPAPSITRARTDLWVGIGILVVLVATRMALSVL